jgi:hypothetical protein
LRVHPGFRATVVYNNLGDSTAGFANQGAAPLAQVFTMPATGGILSALTLGLYSTSGGTATIDLYNASSGGAPFGSVVSTLGSVTVGSSGFQNIAVNSLNNYFLADGGVYAIVLETPASGSVSWNTTTTTGSGGSGSQGGFYYNNGAWTALPVSGYYGQMDLETTPVPEVPMTGVVMGFGALAIAVGSTLRRKFYPTVSGNI